MNFAPDHLDRHPSLEAYFAAKARIFENQGAGDTAVVKLEDRRPATPPERTVTFSAHSTGADYGFDGRWITHHGDRVLDFSATRLRGRHNAENLMAALAAGRAMGVAWDVMGAAARDYRAPRHRCELVGVVEGREFIDDSKATNLHALESCLRALPDPVVLIAGGKDKGLDFAPMRELVASMATHVLAIGQLRPHLVAAWGGAVPVEACDSLEEAVARGLAVSRPGQVVLLSPGTSSFDMFKGYEDRGECFVQAVHRLLSPV
jgi:UDP-N-acetylmuramoylalanine--D-glutamate ligase